jgi:hypothetical protein
MRRTKFEGANGVPNESDKVTHLGRMVESF